MFCHIKQAVNVVNQSSEANSYDHGRYVICGYIRKYPAISLDFSKDCVKVNREIKL